MSRTNEVLSEEENERLDKEYQQKMAVEKERVLNNFWDNISYNDLEHLQAYFVGLREYGGIPIVKDNVESLFEQWSDSLSLEEIQNIL